jgi:putative aldouronate transport system permease protein
MKKKLGVWQILIGLLMLVVLVVTLYPFLYIFANSVSDPILTIRNEVFLIPNGFQTNTYRLLLQSSSLITSYKNTIWYTVVGTLVSTFVVLFAAYPLSRKSFFLRRKINAFFLVTMYFSGGMLPLFITINRLGLYNTRWAIVLPIAANVYYIIIARSYFEGIPESMIESARLDGANDLQIMLKIILGVSGSITAVIVLFNAVGYWNTYFNALIYLPSTSLQPMQVFLNKLLVQQLTNTTGASGAAGQMSMERSLNVHQFKYAAIIITILPIVFVYPFVQKHFVKGVMIGSVKS